MIWTESLGHYRKPFSWILALCFASSLINLRKLTGFVFFVFVGVFLAGVSLLFIVISKTIEVNKPVFIMYITCRWKNFMYWWKWIVANGLHIKWNINSLVSSVWLRYVTRIFYFYVYCDYRLLDLVVQPVPQPSQCLGFIQHIPPRSPLYLVSSSLSLSSQLKESRQNASRASELHLLETPLVVKVSITYLAFMVKLRSSFQVAERNKLFIIDVSRYWGL